jgi:hypothetical protein
MKVTERESFAYFVFRKGHRTPLSRMNTEPEGDAELARCAGETPDATFILAREIRRARNITGKETDNG